MRVAISRVEKDGKMTLQESGGMAIVTIHRPAYKNAMTAKMWKEFVKITAMIPANRKNKVVILRGTDGLFTSGSDIKEFNQMTPDEVDEAFWKIERALETFEKLPLPTLALIDGPALGAGFELALACDLRYGTSRAKMGMPVARLGITLSRSFMRRMADIIGTSRAKELIYTGKVLDARQSQDWGLLNDVIPDGEEANRFILQLADQIKRQSSASLRAAKKGAASLECHGGHLLTHHYVDPEDFSEGVRAFIEKRAPRFFEK